MVSYLLAKVNVTIKTVNHAQPANLHFIFVGYPGTGKSAAIKHVCMKLLHKIMPEDFNNCVIERSTSSGLVKPLAIYCFPRSIERFLQTFA
jgi:Cdc6-like AAA superfamily ATPase